MKFYKIGNGHYASAEIEEVEAIRETEQCIFVAPDRYSKNLERKVAKHSAYETYYPTWDKAHAALTATAEARLATARAALEREHGFAGNVKGMKKPVNI